MGDLLSLAERIDKLDEQFSGHGNDLKKKAAVEVLDHLTAATPVDTSNAVSNWQVGVNQKIGSSIKPYFPGILGSTAAQSSQMAFEVGKRKIEQSKPGEVIYLSNLVDYIKKLNAGTSKQAPAGFVEASVAIARNQLKSVKFKG